MYLQVQQGWGPEEIEVLHWQPSTGQTLDSYLVYFGVAAVVVAAAVVVVVAVAELAVIVEAVDFSVVVDQVSELAKHLIDKQDKFVAAEKNVKK